YRQDQQRDGPDAEDVLGATSPDHPYSAVDGLNLNQYLEFSLRGNYTLVALDTQYNMSWAQLRSITSYGVVENRTDGDNTGAAPFISAKAGQPAYVALIQQTDLKKVSQEVRLSSPYNDDFPAHRLDWQFGLFYTNESVGLSQQFLGFAFPSRVLLPVV